MKPAIIITEFHMTPTGLLHALVILREDRRVLQAYPLYIPPLDMPLRAAECKRRAEAYAAAAIGIIKQMYMSTTRGLNA